MAEPLYRANVLVCSGTGCTSSGSPSVIEAMRAEVVRRGLENEVRVVETGCRALRPGPCDDDLPGGHLYRQVQPQM